jgi:hypothetical protein
MINKLEHYGVGGGGITSFLYNCITDTLLFEIIQK